MKTLLEVISLILILLTITTNYQVIAGNPSASRRRNIYPEFEITVPKIQPNIGYLFSPRLG